MPKRQVFPENQLSLNFAQASALVSKNPLPTKLANSSANVVYFSEALQNQKDSQNSR